MSAVLSPGYRFQNRKSKATYRVIKVQPNGMVLIENEDSGVRRYEWGGYVLHQAALRSLLAAAPTETEETPDE